MPHAMLGGVTDLVAVLNRYGIKVQDHRIPGRPGSFKPIAVLNHHTGMKGPGLAVCLKGRPDLKAPLAQVNIVRDGTINLVTDGKANHAGKGSSHVVADLLAGRPVTKDARDRQLADDTDGNPLFIGIEVDNDGVEPPTQAQLASLGMVNAALCLHFGWPAERCIHHRQWTKRKIDMAWRGDLTGIVRWWMGALPKPKPAR